MASGDMSTQLPNMPMGFVKDGVLVVDSRIGGLSGPLPDSQHRHRVPDERDVFMSWLRGEFAAANAIIDTLCHHLQMVGHPGEYDFVLACIQQRRYNWTVVLHMQQYFSVAEVVFALQQVILHKKHAMNPDSSNLPPPYGSAENGVGYVWKEQTNVYRDGRGEPLIQGALGLQHDVASEEIYVKKEIAEVPIPEDQPCSVDEQKQELVANDLDSSAPSPRGFTDVSDRPNDDSEHRSDVPKSETSCPTTHRISAVREDKESDEEKQEQVGTDGGSTPTLDEPEVRESIPYFQISSKEEDDRRLAAVKSSKIYNCTEQVDGKMVNIVEGLELHEKVLEILESRRLLSLLHEFQAMGKRGEITGSANLGSRKSKSKGRDVIHFGNLHHQLPEDSKKRLSNDENVQPLPAFLQDIIDRLLRWHIVPAGKRPDLCTVNILDEGEYVPPHVSSFQLERPICVLTLQSECTMIFGQSVTVDSSGSVQGTFQLTLPVGSVLVLKKNSADVAKHTIPASSSKRVSLVFCKSTSRPSKTSGTSRSPPLPAAPISQTPWPSYNGGGSRQSNSSNPSGRGSGYSAPFKSHNFTPVSSGVLPVPTVRSPSQVLQSGPTSPVQSLFPSSGNVAAGAYQPPVIPSWSVPRPPAPARPPTAGTGVFFPSGGASSGPGRPASSSAQRKSGGSSPSSPPLLQKTTSAPASLASLDVSPAPKTSKSNAVGGSEKATARAQPGSPRDSTGTSGKQPITEAADPRPAPRSDIANGANGNNKNGKEENLVRTSERSKVLAGSNRSNMFSIGSVS